MIVYREIPYENFGCDELFLIVMIFLTVMNFF